MSVNLLQNHTYLKQICSFHLQICLRMYRNAGHNETVVLLCVPESILTRVHEIYIASRKPEFILFNHQQEK